MSLTRRILFGVAASWFSRGLTIVLGLVLMPVLFRVLPREELGVWLLLGQSWGALAVLDLGFGVTLTRRIAFAKGRSGPDPAVKLTDETRAEIADLLATGLWVYRALAVLAFVVAFGLGFFYLRTLTLESLSVAAVWITWGILCLSQALTVWAAPWACLLQGVGHVGWDAVLASFVSALTLVSQIIVALLGGGLVSLAVVAAAGALLQRVVVLGFARRKRPELFALRGRWRPEVLRSMWPLALRAWGTSLGAAMILYTDQFVIASLEGARELPAYRAAWVLIHNVTVVAVTFGLASGVFVAHLWQSGEIAQVHRLLERNVRLAWLLMLAAAAVLLFAGEAVFALWLGAGNFVGYPVLLAFLLTETLEAQNCVITCASRATEDEAFAVSSVVAGVLKVVFSVLLAREFGLLGVALGTVFALLLTNHWYMPWRGLERLRYSRWRFVRRTILPCLGFFAVSAGALAMLRAALGAVPPGWWVGGSVAVVAALLGIALWWLVFTSSERVRLLAVLRLRPALA